MIDNAFTAACNSQFRAECPNLHRFALREEARTIIEAWRVEYSTERPHGARCQQTPAAFSAAWRPLEVVAG